MAYDQTIINQFMELRARSVPYAEIAAQLNVNRNTALRWGQKRKAEMDALAAVEAEALRHKYFGSRHKEVEALAKRLTRLEAEIDHRNPEYMATRELTALIRVTRARLDQLCVEPVLPEESSG